MNGNYSQLLTTRLFKDLGVMPPDRRLGEVQLIPNLAVGQPFGDQGQDVQLALSKRFEKRRAWKAVTVGHLVHLKTPVPERLRWASFSLTPLDKRLPRHDITSVIEKTA